MAMSPSLRRSNDITFSVIKDKEWPWQVSKLSQDLYTKWNLSPDLSVVCFRPSVRISSRSEEITTLETMMNDQGVRSILGCPNRSESALDNIIVCPISCNVFNMSFFDPLVTKEIISKTGCIYSCPDEEINGLLIQDRLREMFSKENADNTNHVFSNGQRSEFIYHLLKLIALGGSMCQAEERFGPLKAAVKTMYKELVQVHKDSSDKIHVSSTVYEIEPCSSGVESTIFPVASPFNKCYGIVSNNGMKVTLVYKPFKAFW